jgi:phosphoribosyl 1,2-cyclic phosphodiesterase
MALNFASLNSGSNGNCYYIGNEEDAVLIDAGLSCREIERRMRKIGLSLEKVRAIFISHEHGDHIRGLQVLSKRYYLPVYISEPTLRYTRMPPDFSMVRSLSSAEIIQVGDLQITAFQKRHDAVDPYSFVVEQNDIRVGVFTDIGSVCPELSYHFGRCHAAFLEANYDKKMLEEGRYPFHLKRRISGGQGHLSNDEALELFRSKRPSYMRHLLLAHLSQDNNDPVLVKQIFEEVSNGVQITVASRFGPSPVFSVGDVVREPNSEHNICVGQLSLF